MKTQKDIDAILSKLERKYTYDIDEENMVITIKLIDRNPKFIQYYEEIFLNNFPEFKTNIKSLFNFNIIAKAIDYLKDNYSEDDIGEYVLQALPLLRGEEPFGDEWMNIKSP